MQKHAWVTTTPGATPVCAPENEKAAEGGDSQGGSRSFRLFSQVYESGAFPSYVLGCGSRLIPTVPWLAKFAMPCQSRRAHTCPTTPWRLVTLDADAINMVATKRTLACPQHEVNKSVRAARSTRCEITRSVRKILQRRRVPLPIPRSLQARNVTALRFPSRHRAAARPRSHPQR